MMKKFSTIAISGLLALTSCDMDINENPNYPSNSDVTATLIFPAVENFIADCMGDQMFNYAGFFAQYFEQMPSANQYNDLAELNLNESSNLFDRCYTYLYAGALEDIHEILSRTDEITGADAYACTVMRAFAYQLLIDNLSNAPYTEALQSTAITMPKWDNGEDVYNGVLAELDEAEKNIAGTMTLTDPMLSKNIAQWKGFANALRLRMLFRLIDGGVNADANIAKVKSLVNANNFFAGDITWNVYSPNEGQFNPWYGGFYSLGTKNHCAAYPIVSYMEATNDPRISYAMSPREKDNTWYGQMPGAKTVQSGWIGMTAATYNNTAVTNIKYDIMKDAPIYLFTQAELQFLIAEAELRFNNNDENAMKAYKLAVQTDFTSRNAGSADAFLSNTKTMWAGSDSEKLELIYRQKWVALFMRDHMEAWSEARRTDIPALSKISGKEIVDGNTDYVAGDFIEPSVNYILAGGLALRVPYPMNARNYNNNTPSSQLLSDRVFWDKK